MSIITKENINDTRGFFASRGNPIEDLTDAQVEGIVLVIEAMNASKDDFPSEDKRQILAALDEHMEAQPRYSDLMAEVRGQLVASLA